MMKALRGRDSYNLRIECAVCERLRVGGCEMGAVVVLCTTESVEQRKS